ncbi:TetR/AcrR family transcriptional regulator [Streptomyces benahoarensis]|uniref:TetR/AcrR family transcriptional regulator n=1 Tax=Streptomyces benahoarensis TaxID=2595054 RepID=A0A553ZRE7_9ACTN|nr:TetR/AcrR family transcriptional regulator [Streptomyces benahoarensis]TSB18815.1 TetR/AcrR family transcriptional regulator [Streptomyces benahoarensis]TSB44017.1 TetR/AcrR family transcriptional regulator [Streptomyces benahoarensis]
MSGGGSGAARSDARRNRALVLQAARSAFAEGGLAVTLDEIARRAGVGAGTVHRHFPSKGKLFAAAVTDRVRLFADTARDLADVTEPGEVFFRFLASVVRLATENRALGEALEAADTAGPGGAAEAGREFVAGLDVLLRRAQEAGAVRADVVIGDVRTLLVGCLAMERRRAAEGDTAGVPGRMTELACDALRASRTVTKLPSGPRRRNATECGTCGAPVPVARTGRPARYCGGACRQKAHRARRARARTGDGASVEPRRP